MTLDATAREANIRDSLKKYFIDTFETAKGIIVTFDKGLSNPDLQPGSTVHRWISVNQGPIEIKDLSDIFVYVYCCTRQDNEGFKLAQLVDTVMEGLSVDPATATTSLKRITFYRSLPAPDAWVPIGALVVQSIDSSMNLEAPDETKYKILNVRLRTASKV